MKFAVVGSGAVGGYYGARLARAGHEVAFIARGAHLRAMRERGLSIRSPLGDFTVKAPAEDAAGRVGPVDVVLFAVKTYDNATALPMLSALVGPSTMTLTLQNGVDSVDQVAAVAGERAVLAGPTYIATALAEPGVIVQTGTHRRIVFGEVFGDRRAVSERASRLRAILADADIQAEAVPDGRVPLWEKFIYLAPFAGFTGAARQPVGGLWSQAGFRDVFVQALSEVERIARAEGVGVSATVKDDVLKYVDSVPPTMRSSLLIDLQQGKKIEVEALIGSVVRRGRAAGVETPMMLALYSVLKPYEDGKSVDSSQ
jgi:2-dehydropantoate 2-reductase